MYDQKKYELRVSHIMLGADAEGTDDNRKLAESLIKRLTMEKISPNWWLNIRQTSFQKIPAGIFTTLLRAK